MKSKQIEGRDLRATEPATFSRRAQRYPTMEARLVANSVLDPASECWIWCGKQSGRRGGRVDGRISLRLKGGKHVSRRAHRVSYETFRGEIPLGQEIDHKCRNTLCINPAHLEAVTPGENIVRRDKACICGDIENRGCKIHGHLVPPRRFT